MTGISGYVGSHVGLVLLKEGIFNVRGTVRDPNNAAKLAPLRKAYGELFDKVEFVKADLLDPASMTAAIAGSTYVIHIASPVVIEVPRDPMSLIGPAIEGTMAVMKAAKAAGVKRVCMTSSTAAITYMDAADKP